MKRAPALLGLFCLGLAAGSLQAAEDSALAAKAVNQFAAAHHRQLPAGNVLVSPWSVQMQLALLANGAGGSTRTTMRTALFLEADEAALNQSFHALNQAMIGQPQEAAMARISVASRLFVARSLPLQPAWQETARSYFGAAMQTADFRQNIVAETEAINRWAEQQTHGKIPVAVPVGALTPDTLLALVNAVHFDMPWDERFTQELTQQRTFYLNARRSKTVPMMFKQHALRYARKGGVQIAAVPYADGAFQFVVLLPDALEGLAAVEAHLTGELLSECATLPPAEVRLSLPRIAMSPPVTGLKQTLSALGAAEMFDEGRADFSRMIDDSSGLGAHVSNVFHGTFIELDEDGTKAAAVTTTVIRPKNGVPREVPHQVVRADHPFLFMIQHMPSGACLFLGRVTDPQPRQPEEDAPAYPPRELSPAKKK